MQGGSGFCHLATPSRLEDGRRCPRDVFPLPPVQVTEFTAGGASRKVQRRQLRRRHFEDEVNRTVDSLNQMYGRPGLRQLGTSGNQSNLSAAQAEFLEFIENAVGEAGVSDGLSGPEALMALRVSQGYEDLPTSSPLASFNSELVALPSGVLSPVPLEELIGQDGQQQVEDFTMTQTLASDEAMRSIGVQGLGRSYEDPQFRNNSHYSGFVRRLLDLGLLDVVLEEPVETTGMFFVKKKGNKQRLIFDCRRSNCHFSTPEPIRLATGDSIGRIETKRTTLFTASADLQNAFYTMSMPMALRKFFGLRGLRAEQLGISECDGKAIRPGQRVFPRIAVIPMGWSWAMWWCQRVNELLCEKGGLTEDRRLRDGSPVPSGSFWHVQYVDNLHVFGTDRKQVEDHFWKAVTTLRDAGLTVHEMLKF